MYPTITDLLNDLFGFYFPLPIQTFGFFMALSFMAAYQLTASELKRKTAMGLLQPISKKVIENKPISTQDILVNTLLGALIGFKVVEMLLDYEALVQNPQAFILSAKGSWFGLILGAVGGYYLMQRDAQKLKGTTPKEVVKQFQPVDLMWNITAIAGISGILGAKIFHNLEYIDDLMRDPIGSLLSFSGLTFYGGLIVATVAVLYYTRKHQIPTKHMIDAAAPGLMLAYAIGRIGCQLSGDGDWGIVNLAPKPEWLSFAPDWVWSFTYPHNVIDEGIPMAGCEGAHCYQLPQAVYPTPFYEVLMAGVLALGLWLIRKRITIPGMLFCIYLVVNGVERFTIEKIRVNSTYSIFGHAITQAELISSAMIVVGIAGIFILAKGNKHETTVA
jgi:prolipoprotein diacylglyceryltransferase